jgi:hypothetical protein
MKSKYKIGDMFDCYGNIIVITSVENTSGLFSKYKHLYRFNHLRSSSISDVWQFFVNYFESDLDKFKKLEI